MNEREGGGAVKTAKIIVIVLCALSVVPIYGQRGRGGRGAPQAPATNTVATAIPGVVAAGTPVTVIKEGFQGTEGPITLPDGSVIFTEPGANRISKIDKDGNVSVFLENTNSSNGLAFDSKGRLISTQTTAGQERIGVIYPKGSEATLAEKFGRPNDLVVNKAGGIYFTAPGASPAVFYIPPDGAAVKVNEDIDNPNGIQLSRDEKTLYVNNTRGEYMLAFDIQPDGKLANKRNFAQYQGVTKNDTGVTSGADGIAVDNDGRVYAAINSTGGVQVFSPEGKYLGTIPTSLGAQNIAFAGADKKTLYIVGRGAAFKVQMLSQGFSGRAK
jgi:gluconolactonase